jgi:hypothetical protein
MSITDELREWLDDNSHLGSLPDLSKQLLRSIADRIDEQREKDALGEYTRGYNAGFNAASDKEPVDADGVPIRVGDVMEWPTTGETFEVVGISANTLFYIEHDFDDSAQWTAAHDKRHHCKPTVEDVLREFAEKMNENIGMYVGEAIDADEWRDADRQTIAEYAAKLRLAGEAE